MMPDGQQEPRVCLVATHTAPALGWGGIAENTARLARAWAAAGRPFALCVSDGSEGPSLTAAAVARHLGLPSGGGPGGEAEVPIHLYRAWGWKRWGFGPGALPALYRACRDAERVYVNGVATWPTSLAVLVCRWLGRPYAVAVHGGLMPGHVDHIRRRKPLKWLFYRLITLPGLRAARAVHATAAVEADGVRALLPGARVVDIPNALDPADWPPLPPRTPDGGRVLCYIGRLSPEKGILPFLRLWLEERGPRDRLIVAGSGGGEYGAAVERLAADADGAVELCGYVDHAGLLDALARSDLVVLPSGLGEGGVRENFGYAVIEGMATGRPALVNRGMAWDGLEAEGAGLLFDPDPQSARAAIRRALALAPDELAAMAAAARRVVERDYRLEVVAERVWRMVTER
ncbi:glycosyltransferase [Azospirillum sp. RWY-5-1]|uniref:Glycosyltransferase n=1 Tax=Azospirillum oleiclasticum TaxID=2735135 RepID=A0ABX2TLM5_9PROT|nr:glycosyltransferase [Azospirillum oleiclasticum]NYZ17523.1 glycosyltransferase [Azospirillum oleiclasticum]NYZ24625.1 glycosyltransferase [Azospirillum oleiclasticum]